MFVKHRVPIYRFAEAVKIMVALSILFSYGLQFCVPSEIVWTRLEPWLRNRRQNGQYSINNKDASTVVVSTITGNNVNSTTVLSSTAINNRSIDEKKQLEMELEKQAEPMLGAYYIMRASMILGTGMTLRRLITNSIKLPLMVTFLKR